MHDFLKKEINRQEHMDMRYKSIDEELYKQDDNETPKADNDDTESKYLEQNYMEFRKKLIEDLGVQIDDEPAGYEDDDK
jgi:hypothetical protein